MMLNENVFLILTLCVFQSIFCKDEQKVQQNQEARNKLSRNQKALLDKKLLESIGDINDDKLLQEKVDELLKAGANPNFIGSAGGLRGQDSSLDLALWKNRTVNVIKILVDYGAELTSMTMLKAIQYGSSSLPMIQLLEQNGGKLDDVNFGKTLLMKAAEKGKFDVVDYLISKGVNKSLKDSAGATYKEYALTWAIAINDFVRMKEYLNLGANPNQRIDMLGYPLEIKTSTYLQIKTNSYNAINSDTIKLLIDHGADPYTYLNLYKGDTKQVIDLIKDHERREFIKDYYKQRQEKIKNELEHFPSGIPEIITSY